ncbi:MAG: BatD family protein, partial [Thiomicrorhabdus sp.]|nr:BatD family protein [Thiomicrorhabdus sp.]
IQEVAENQTLTVLPEPTALKNNPNDPWLPAKKITLSETWQTQPNTVRVGDSLTRTLRLEAQGLRASQLPALSTENQAGFKVYNDQPVTEETLAENGIYSQLQQTQTLILTQAGQITLPEQRINWFNTQTETMETATINARTLTVLPALNTVGSNSTTVITSPENNKQMAPSHYSESLMTENVPRETSFIWPLITSLLGFAWFITLILWRRQTKQLKAQLQQLATNTPLKTQPPLAQSSETLALCNGKEMPVPSAFYNQLKTQLKEKYFIESFNALENSDLKQAIYQLEAHLFSNAELPDNTLNNICSHLTEMAKNFSPPSQKQSKKGKKLASLYKH